MLSILLLAAITCVAPASDELVGLWESRDTSRGGIGHTLEFRSDGTAVASTAVIVNAYYLVLDGELLVGETPEFPTQPGPHITIQDGTMVETHADGTTIKKDRVEGSGSVSDSLVGAWSYLHYTGVTAYERYTDDGRMLFRLPMSAYLGCYTMSNRELSMTAPKNSTVRFELRDDELILHNEEREPFVYRRVIAGPWYPRDPDAIRSQAEAAAAQQ